MFRTITPILSIAIALFAYFFYIQPLFTDINSVKQEIAQYDEAVKNANEKNQLLNNLIAKKNSYSEFERNRLDSLIPREVDEVRLLVDLTEIARSHNMLIGNISVSNNVDASGFSSNTANSNDSVDHNSFINSDITFGLIGTYEQFKGFLQDIERSLVLMEIINIAFTSGDGSLQQFDMTVRIFALPQVN